MSGTTIKPSAFQPAKDMKTSVFRKDRMRASVYTATRNAIASERSKPIIATALIRTDCVLSTDLRVEPEETDYRWHADIVGWDDFGVETKSYIKQKSQELAQQAYLEKSKPLS